MASKFRLCTRAMTTPQQPRRRQEILQRHLSAAQAALLEYPIERWKTANREAFDAFSCSIPSPKTVSEIPPADPADVVFGKIGIYRGPVTHLAVDAIVNAANETALGGGGVDGAIHRAAGPLLVRECATHNGCQTGEAILTKGYNLSARYVIHTVGPVGEHPELLRRCYRSVLALAEANGLRSIGLCGISTGAYGYPMQAATKIAVEEVSRFIKEHVDAVDFVCFACYLDDEAKVTAEELRARRLHDATKV